ncbi:hypothetical protein ACF8PU_19365, partial [Pseudomonas sp. GLN_6]
MNFTPPAFEQEAFHCPICGTYAHMTWEDLYSREGRLSLCCEATCAKCNSQSVWRVISFDIGSFGRCNEKGELLYPDSGVSALPEPDMPTDVKEDYMEASRIFSRSPRGAAALLRL